MLSLLYPQLYIVHSLSPVVFMLYLFMPVQILNFSYIWWYLIYFFKIFVLLVSLILILWSRWFCSLSFFYTDCVIGGWNLQRSLANETSDSVYVPESLELCVCMPSCWLSPPEKLRHTWPQAKNLCPQGRELQFPAGPPAWRHWAQASLDRGS